VGQEFRSKGLPQVYSPPPLSFLSDDYFIFLEGFFFFSDSPSPFLLLQVLVAPSVFVFLSRTEVGNEFRVLETSLRFSSFLFGFGGFFFVELPSHTRSQASRAVERLPANHFPLVPIGLFLLPFFAGLFQSSDLLISYCPPTIFLSKH